MITKKNYVAYTGENHNKKSLFSLFIKVNIYKEILNKKIRIVHVIFTKNRFPSQN